MPRYPTTHCALHVHPGTGGRARYIVNYPPLTMFGLFKKNPTKELEKQHERLLEEAMQLQRKGDIKGYAAKTAEAERVMDQIVELQKGR